MGDQRIALEEQCDEKSVSSGEIDSGQETEKDKRENEGDGMTRDEDDIASDGGRSSDNVLAGYKLTHSHYR